MMTTTEISEQTGVHHGAVLNMADKYRDVLVEFGELKAYRVPTDGRARREIILNEAQQFALVMLMKNTPQVVQLKKDLTMRMFEDRMRR